MLANTAIKRVRNLRFLPINGRYFPELCLLFELNRDLICGRSELYFARLIRNSSVTRSLVMMMNLAPSISVR